VTTERRGAEGNKTIKSSGKTSWKGLAYQNITQPYKSRIEGGERAVEKPNKKTEKTE